MITIRKAKEIAQKEVNQRAQKYKDQGLAVGELGIAFDNEKAWTFAAPILQLQEEGYAPCAIMVSVDKEDGHVWSEKDWKKPQAFTLTAFI